MSIYKKLAEAKKEIGKIKKDSRNPHFKNTYFDINTLLETVEPILESHGLMILQPLVLDEIHTLIIDLSDDSKIESRLKLPVLNDPQKMGSAITYYRRYTLQSLLSLQAEDDDANLAAGHSNDANSKSMRQADDRPWLNEGTAEYKEIEMYIENGKLTDINQITKYKVSKKTKELLMKLIG